MPVTEAYVRELFNCMVTGNVPQFAASLADDMEWVIVNPNDKTFLHSGTYDKKTMFEAMTSLMKCFAAPPEMQLRSLIVAGNKAVIESRTIGKGVKDGSKFDNCLCVVCEFDNSNPEDEEPQIKKVHEYYDSALVDAFCKANGERIDGDAA
ncbi:hypothetical protein I317_04645 [Kwoniella heveanensis CBS 569]|nr:hypothetical protein I317_04645 [Kwoniella heveanensis CBS 569]